ncbi:penicillin-binding protein 1C [Oxalobacteraceae bacterium GrIS 2.11]
MIRSSVTRSKALWQHLPNRLRKAVIALISLAAFIAVIDQCFPLPVRGQGADFAAVVVARDGTPLRAFPDAQHIWRYPVTLEQVAPEYIDALIRYEDRAFWWHPGVNPWGMLRAVGQWARYGHVISGGSTLTMQVARLIEPVPHTLWGKLRQLLRALQLELHYSKREILEIYLNYAPMGGVIEGVEAASRSYLGKPSSRLTRAEAALLTVLPQSPSRLRLDRFVQHAQATRDKVIRRMRGHWSESDIADALSEPVLMLRAREPMLAPLLAQRLHQQYPLRARVESTVDAQTQQMVELLLQDRANALPDHVSAAALVMDNRDLSVAAYAGSADFGDRTRFPWVDMVRAVRSPGSTLKPFLYGFALDDGLIDSESLLIDAPQVFHGYAPGNFGQAFSGPVSASDALVRSLNVPAVQVLDHITPERFVGRLRQGGLKLVFPKNAGPNLSVILGGVGTSLESLVGGYSALGRSGQAGWPRLEIHDPLTQYPMMSPGAAYIIRAILEGGGLTSQAVGLRADRHGVAYKTGTSYGFRDAWTIGVSDRYTVGVWIGRPDGTPNPGFYGANIAAPMMQAIFNGLAGNRSEATRAKPDSVSQAVICWPEGYLAEQSPAGVCQQKRLAWLLNQTAPPTLPGEHDPPAMRSVAYLDIATGMRVVPECTSRPYQQIEVARWPVLLEPWLTDTNQLPAWRSGCRSEHTAVALHIKGAVDRELLATSPGQPSPVLRLNAHAANGQVTWLVNGVYTASSEGEKAKLFELAKAGRYDITAIDQDGHFDRVTVFRK